MPRVNFLNCPVDSLTIQEALDWIAGCIHSRQPHTITPLNAHKLWQMSRNPRLAQFVRGSDLVIPEWAVVWGCARLGTPLKAHVGGFSLLQTTLPWMEQQAFRPFFLGARPMVIKRLAQRLKTAYPGLQIAGLHHGFLRDPAGLEVALRMIQSAGPDLLFVAMGTPRQEYWIQENLPLLKVPVAMGVGGSFDVLAGLKKDAPAWARGHGLEWLIRLAQEPKAYWRRYLITNTWFVREVMKSAMNRIDIQEASTE